MSFDTGQASVKIAADRKGYIIQGAIGVGLGSWSRAAKIRSSLGLSALPVSVSEADWSALDGEIVVVSIHTGTPIDAPEPVETD